MFFFVKCIYLRNICNNYYVCLIKVENSMKFARYLLRLLAAVVSRLNFSNLSLGFYFSFDYFHFKNILRNGTHNIFNLSIEILLHNYNNNVYHVSVQLRLCKYSKYECQVFFLCIYFGNK